MDYGRRRLRMVRLFWIKFHVVLTLSAVAENEIIDDTSTPSYTHVHHEMIT